MQLITIITTLQKKNYPSKNKLHSYQLIQENKKLAQGKKLKQTTIIKTEISESYKLYFDKNN
mgnify:CR=1 FL=1